MAKYQFDCEPLSLCPESRSSGTPRGGARSVATASRRSGRASAVGKKVPLNEEVFRTDEEKHDKWRFSLALIHMLALG